MPLDAELILAALKAADANGEDRKPLLCAKGRFFKRDLVKRGRPNLILDKNHKLMVVAVMSMPRNQTNQKLDSDTRNHIVGYPNISFGYTSWMPFTRCSKTGLIAKSIRCGHGTESVQPSGPTLFDNRTGQHPPVQDPPNQPQKPPVEEPGDLPERPPLPDEPPVEEPPDKPGKPPVKEPPPQDPNRPPPPRPPVRVSPDRVLV